MQAVSGFTPAWGEAGEAWTSPTTWKSWELSDPSASLAGAHPYLRWVAVLGVGRSVGGGVLRSGGGVAARLLAGVLSPIFDAETAPAVVEMGIKALHSLCWDKSVGEGVQVECTTRLSFRPLFPRSDLMAQ
jgi:hypothetical protein